MREKNVFHEIKNQISVCDLYTEIIRRTLEKKGVEDETLTRALQNIKNSLELIAESAKSVRPVLLSTFNLVALVNDVFEICKTYKNIDFLNEIPSDMIINTDRIRFMSALTNIVKNAIEANATHVKIYAVDKNIFISNNGDPIPEQIQENIFTDGFTTKEYGTGLGLMLTKEMLNECGFDLRLTQSDQNVTMFNIYHI